MKTAIYPGSFDPITNGHLIIIERASKLFDKLYVCVASNIAKTSYFSLDERFYMVKETCKHFENVEVISTDELVIKVAKELHCNAIVRGLRAVTDFEYEFQLAAGNQFIDNSIEMVFLMATNGMEFISSSSVKEFVKFNVDVSQLVPPIVDHLFQEKSENYKK